ncbi:MAG TPA: hypothetical protein VGD76_18485 [Ramlibacter sp.]
MKKLLALLFPLLLLQACAIPQALPEAADLRAGDGEVVVIGKIELVPPLEAGERRSHWNVVGEKRMFRIWMATGPDFRPVTPGQVKASEFQTSLEADWGVPFMVKAPRRRTFLNGGVSHLDVLQNAKLWFPGGFYFDVPPDARAVYIGTLRFHRNDFNTITRVEIVEERKDIGSVLKSGSPGEVRNSLLKRAVPAGGGRIALGEQGAFSR